MEDIIWKTFCVRNIMEDKAWKMQVIDFMFHRSGFLVGQSSQNGLEKDIVKITIYYLLIYTILLFTILHCFITKTGKFQQLMNIYFFKSRMKYFETWKIL